MTLTSRILSRPDLAVPGVSLRETGIGTWSGEPGLAVATGDAITKLIRNIRHPVFCLAGPDGSLLYTAQGQAMIGGEQGAYETLPLLAFTPALDPVQLGDPAFCQDLAVRYPYMCGSMANAIASTELVSAISRAGLLASFGAAGLNLQEIENAIDILEQELGELPYAFNLIYSPNEKGHEEAVVNLYLRRGIHLVEASAYMKLTLPVVRFRVHGIRLDGKGQIETPNRIIAKASRIEVASKWFSPPPDKLLAALVEAGELTREQAELAQHIPMAQDLTVEADSGGHTDNRPAITLLPTILALRDRMQAQHGYTQTLRVGMAGGIATPASAAAAFAMGAAYIVTGTINQACVESGSSDLVRRMLGEAEQADIAMAPAVDMFEMGVKVQVLKRGTMFAMRANKLYELYRSYDSIEAIPEKERQSLEKTIFRASLEDIWSLTQGYFKDHDPGQIERAGKDPKHKMALIFRWYLGLSSRWANAGEDSRQMDYQVWCGPSMGAFNEWTRDTCLGDPARRKVVPVAMNILYGAAVSTRINHLRNQGIRLPREVIALAPLELDEIEAYLS